MIVSSFVGFVTSLLCFHLALPQALTLAITSVMSSMGYAALPYFYKILDQFFNKLELDPNKGKGK